MEVNIALKTDYLSQPLSFILKEDICIVT